MGDTQQGHAQAAFLGQCVTADSCQPVWDTAVTVVCTTPRVSSHPGPHGATAWGGELSDEEDIMSLCLQGEVRVDLQTLLVLTAVSLSPSCSCLMAPMAVALILGE